METTVSLDPDVAAEVDRIRRVEGVGLSEALNRLARSAPARRQLPHRYEPRPVDLGLTIDVTTIGAVLDMLDDGG